MDLLPVASGLRQVTAGMSVLAGTITDGEGLVDARVRAVVMLTVALAWLAYVGSEVFRGRQPEVWTWGILTGVYAALYQPWAGRSPGGRAGGQNEVPGPNGLPGPGLPGLPATKPEDETT